MISPLLTYIVPLYNTEAYVQRCLQSIVEQGLEDDQYEVLVEQPESGFSSVG